MSKERNFTVATKDPRLLEAAHRLKEANAILSEAKKIADDTKEVIASRLQALIGISVEQLTLGDSVTVNDGELTVEVSAQNRFDQQRFKFQHPGLFDAFKRKFRCVRYILP